MTAKSNKDHLIWSNLHSAWWRPNFAGYTNSLAQAGRYTREEAYARASAKDVPRLTSTVRDEARAEVKTLSARIAFLNSFIKKPIDQPVQS